MAGLKELRKFIGFTQNELQKKLELTSGRSKSMNLENTGSRT